MDVYILESKVHGKDFLKMIKNLKCISTADDLLSYGFTNYNKPHLYYCKRIDGTDKYPVSFNLTLSAKNLSIKEVMIFDEMFGQPHFVDKEYNKKIKVIIDDLISKNLFSIK